MERLYSFFRKLKLPFRNQALWEKKKFMREYKRRKQHSIILRNKKWEL